MLGGGRAQKGDTIDPGVGIVLHAKVGAEVAAGEPLLTMYHRGRGFERALELVRGAVVVADARSELPPLILDTLSP